VRTLSELLPGGLEDIGFAYAKGRLCASAHPPRIRRLARFPVPGTEDRCGRVCPTPAASTLRSTGTETATPGWKRKFGYPDGD
jgi:hypothetical protein